MKAVEPGLYEYQFPGVNIVHWNGFLYALPIIQGHSWVKYVEALSVDCKFVVVKSGVAGCKVMAVILYKGNLFGATTSIERFCNSTTRLI